VRIALRRCPALYLIQKAVLENGSRTDFINKLLQINYDFEYRFKITILQK
jgi:hypothetical protein